MCRQDLKLKKIVQGIHVYVQEIRYEIGKNIGLVIILSVRLEFSFWVYQNCVAVSVVKSLLRVSPT